MTLRIKLWGVRGSIACASPDHMKYGGNTSCIEVQAGDHTFVMDAGTGIRNFSKVVLERDIRHTHLLLTHTHWDHINGFPFFTPAYSLTNFLVPNFSVLKLQLKVKSGHSPYLADHFLSS